ncbi:hypothetical protein BYZ73_02725 [Rhodovulum viride]|uniref:Uncharacterized protein n=1 Tax=Rhodovulum viride TaxID=1231134 RepID=A0ABX9DNH8_9RHOB|nr:hypothetical protein [Rhodovulum viride]RAP43106.1 hypothetical protein BYZ73_02725 [Rhodovulum viride]
MTKDLMIARHSEDALYEVAETLDGLTMYLRAIDNKATSEPALGKLALRIEGLADSVRGEIGRRRAAQVRTYRHLH